MEALGQLFWSVSHNLENIRSKSQLTFDVAVLQTANVFVKAVEKPRIHFPYIDIVIPWGTLSHEQSEQQWEDLEYSTRDFEQVI